jgi:hypothetical protein
MSSTITYPFIVPGNYTYDSDEIEIIGGVAQLKIQSENEDYIEEFTSDSGFTYDADKVEFSGGKVQQKSNAIIENYSQPFSSATGFTYDSSKAEFASGLARQKSQRPTNATFGATYTNNINGSWGNGVLTGTGTGDPTVLDGKLVLTESTKFVQYPALNNADSLQAGCIRFKHTPDYSGIPATTVFLMTISQSASNTKNLITLYDDSVGHLYLIIKNYLDAFIIPTVDLGSWNPTSGTEYEFELNWDITGGATRLFINGVQKGTTQTQTGIRSGAIGILNIGAKYNGDFRADAYFNDIEIFSTVQHTANYTPGYTLLETDYLETIVQCPAQSYTYNIASFDVPTITEVNAPKYIVNGYAYFSGSWQASSNTYATAMSYADWITNVATFPGGQLGSGVTVKVVFQDSNILGSIDSVAFTINETHYAANVVTNPEIQHTLPGFINSFVNFATTQSGTSKYTIQIGQSGNYLYWTGSAWATSNGTYAQATSASDFNTNCATLDISGEIYFQFKIHFTDSNTQAYVDLLTVTVDENYAYPIDNPYLITNAGFFTSDLILLEDSVTEDGDDKIKYILNVGGQDKWSNSGTVENSNGTYSQANTTAEINAVIGDFLTSRKTCYVKIFFHSEDELTTPSIDYLTIIYNTSAVNPSVSTLTTLCGFVYDMNSPINNLEIKARPYISGYINSEVFQKYEYETIGTTDIDGYFYGMVLVQPIDKYIEIKIGSQSYKTQLGDQESNNLKDLTMELITIEE